MPDIDILRRGGSGLAFYVIAGKEHAGEVCRLVKADADIISVSVDDWNHQLSPWFAVKCFRDGDDFGGGAREYIAALTAAIPDFEKVNGLAPARRVLCGYSLAGLCALYALYVTDVFCGAVSASGSMWFDGWIDFMEKQSPAAEAVYLSVGDREARTRNRRLASVEECTRRACEILNLQSVHAVFEMNSGNHFCESELRLARGIDRITGILKNN